MGLDCMECYVWNGECSLERWIKNISSVDSGENNVKTNMTTENSLNILKVLKQKCIDNKNNGDWSECVADSYVEALDIAIYAIMTQSILLKSIIDYLHNTGWLSEHDKYVLEDNQKLGQWEETDNSDPCYYKCSVCHRQVDIPEKFCPSCGAKMSKK